MNKPWLIALVSMACIGGCDINDDFCSQPCPTDDTFDVSFTGFDVSNDAFDVSGPETAPE